MKIVILKRNGETPDEYRASLVPGEHFNDPMLRDELNINEGVGVFIIWAEHSQHRGANRSLFVPMDVVDTVLVTDE